MGGMLQPSCVARCSASDLTCWRRQPVGSERCTPFQLCLAILEVFLRLDDVTAAYQFASGESAAPGTNTQLGIRYTS